MPFDEVLNQGDEFAEEAAQRRADTERDRSNEARVEAGFQQELRDFGTWFAAEAKACRLPTLRLNLGPSSPRPARRKRGLFRRPAPSPASTPPPSRPGWALFPLSPHDGEVHIGRSREYDVVYERGDKMSSKRAYTCLVIDETGSVVVGAATQDGICIYSLDSTGELAFVGTPAEQLTRLDVLFRVADLGMSVNLNTDPVGMERDAQAMLQNDLTLDRMLGLFVAHAKLMLESGRPFNPFIS